MHLGVGLVKISRMGKVGYKILDSTKVESSVRLGIAKNEDIDTVKLGEGKEWVEENYNRIRDSDTKRSI